MDPELYLRLINCDNAAWRMLADAHGAFIHRILRKIIGDCDREDAYSELMRRMASLLRTYDPSRPFRPWLFKVTWNYALKFKKRKQRDKSKFVVDGEVLLDNLPSANPTPDKVAETREFLAIIEKVVETFGEDINVRAFSLCCLQGFEYREIACLLRVTEDYARNLVLRGKRKVRDRLRKSFPGYLEEGM